MHASARGHVKVVKLLLDRGAQIDYQNKFQGTEENHTVLEGFSALMVACMADRLEIVKLLLERGAKSRLVNQDWKNRSNAVYDFWMARHKPQFGHPSILVCLQMLILFNYC